jgi:hypothetical protein
MPEYRLFQLDDARHILGQSRITHQTDHDAILEARKSLDGATTEIWEGVRRVATLKGNDDTPRV